MAVCAKGRKRDDLIAEFDRLGLTQIEVAARCYVSRQHLNLVLAGKKPLTRRLAREISVTVGIPLATVLGRDDGDGEATL